MNTARIVVLAIAVGVPGIAACIAGGPDNPSMSAGPVVQSNTENLTGDPTGSGLKRLAAQDHPQEQLRRIAVPGDKSGNQASRRGDRIILAGDGVQGATAQNRPRGRSI